MPVYSEPKGIPTKLEIDFIMIHRTQFRTSMYKKTMKNISIFIGYMLGFMIFNVLIFQYFNISTF